MKILLVVFCLSFSQGARGIPQNSDNFDCCYRQHYPCENVVEVYQYSIVGIASFADRVLIPTGNTNWLWVAVKVPQPIFEQIVPPG